MSNTYTGTGGASGLEVRTFDLATDLFGIDIIEVSNGSLTVGSSPNIAVINTGGGGGGGVTTIAFGTTGLTPAAATAGGVTVAGTLVAANGGTSFSTYAQGDIIYASAADTLSKLAAGADGEVLTLAAGVPSWLASTGGIGGTIAAGQVAFGTAADTIGGSGNLIWNDTGGAERLTVTGSSASDMLRIVSTSTTTGTAPDIAFVRNRTYAVGLDLGIVLFKGPDAANAEHTYAYIQADAKDGTVGAEKGQMDFRVNDGTGANGFPLRISDTGAHFNVINASGLDVRMDTLNVDNAFLMDASADTASFAVKTFVTQSTALTNTATYPVRITHETSGAPAVGLGVGLEFESEGPAQAGVNYVGSIMESVSTAGTDAGTTRYDLVLKNYNGAAASEVARFTSNGGFTTTSSVAAGTTVSVNPDAGGTVTVGGSGGVIVDGTGGVSTVNGAISAGGATGAVTANTSIGAGTTVTGGTGVIATTGGVTAVAGGVLSQAGDVVAVAGSILATIGYDSQIGGQISNPAGPAVGGADLSTPGYFGAVTTLAADTYTISTTTATGATATFITPNAVATVVVDGVNVTSVTGGGATGTAFTCPQFDSFTIYFTTPAEVYVFGNVTVS